MKAKIISDDEASILIGFLLATIVMAYLQILPSVDTIAYQYSLTYLLTSFGIWIMATILGVVAAKMFLNLFENLDKEHESWSD